MMIRPMGLGRGVALRRSIPVPLFLFEKILSRRFARALVDGELDFLDGRVLRVVVSGPLGGSPITFDVTLEGGRPRVRAPAPGREGDACWDLRITGSVRDFLLLAARREDADTLFFQRRLKTEGDTELGLYLKNFLDAQEEAEQPLFRLTERALRGAFALHDRVLHGTGLSRR